MYCLRCGTKVNDNVEYCPHCGSNIKEELARYDYKPTENLQKKTTVNLEPSHEEQFQYSIKYSFGNEEELIKEYVGKNYDKIKNTKFSCPTFFFGPIYFLYRKLYAYAFIWILAIMIFGLLFPGLFLLTSIVIASTFPIIYLKTVKRKVLEIQTFNKNLPKDDIINLCRKKGGVNIIFPLLIIIFIISITVIIIDEVLEDTTTKKVLTNDTTYQIENLEYKIPADFTKDSYDSNSYKSYSYEKDYNYCRVYFSTIDKYIYDSKEEYLKSGLTKTEKTIPIDTKNINGENWIHLNIIDEYSKEELYILEKGTKYYKLNTYNSDNTKICDDQFNRLLNSISYKE